MSPHVAGESSARTSASPLPAGSARLRLARLTHAAALRVPGVAGTDTGPTGRFITVGGHERLDGVTCLAAGGGGYDVSLRLRCELVPLPELVAQVRAAVVQAASEAGIMLAELSVHVADVVEAERM